MDLPDRLIERYAMKLYGIAHPQTPWVIPTLKETAQAKVQDRYMREAKVLLRDIIEDPVIQRLVLKSLNE
jgi:hypothetical protein